MPTRLLPSLLTLLALVAPLRAQTAPDDDLRKQVDAMRRQMEAMAQQIKALQDELAKRGAAAAPKGEDEFYIPRLATDFQQSGQPQTMGNIYTKPFLANLGDRVHLGGYISTQATTSPGSGESQNFDLTPFVPFIYADVSDKVKLAAEIEYDHGHEVELEFAQMDYLFDPALNFRAGIQLLPVGKFNEVHDAPIQELTNRPLVDELVIPTTLRDVGFGAWGRLGDSVTYQTTVTNGFRGLDAAGNTAINLENGMHDAAPQESGLGDPYSQLNDSFAYAARVAVQPTLGTEIGGSALFDHYDELDHDKLRILALDATVDGKATSFLPDAMVLQGEGAWDSIERDAFAKASGVPDDFTGFYVQANYHFEPSWLLADKAAGSADPGARFTFVSRYDRVHLDTYDRTRTTFGLNYRPNAQDTVFKLDYEINGDSGSLAGENDDNALVFSVATYF